MWNVHSWVMSLKIQFAREQLHWNMHTRSDLNSICSANEFSVYLRNVFKQLKVCHFLIRFVQHFQLIYLSCLKLWNFSNFPSHIWLSSLKRGFQKFFYWFLQQIYRAFVLVILSMFFPELEKNFFCFLALELTSEFAWEEFSAPKEKLFHPLSVLLHNKINQIKKNIPSRDQPKKSLNIDQLNILLPLSNYRFIIWRLSGPWWHR